VLRLCTLAATLLGASTLAFAPACRRAGDDGESAAHSTTPPVSVPPSASKVSLAGRYSSTLGPATVVEDAREVTMTWPAGSASCRRKAEELQCTWTQGPDRGRATLVRYADGRLMGTWGVGQQDKGGGTWTFVPDR
jgi:hypothetical protein